MLATASGDKTLKLWALKDLSCVRTFEGHTAAVLKVRLPHWHTAAWRSLALFCSAGFVAAFATPFRPVGTNVLRRDNVHLSQVVFITAGTQLASAGGDGLLKVRGPPLSDHQRSTRARLVC